LAILIVLVVTGSLYRTIRRSQIIGNPYRYNLILAADQAQAIFVSFDPEEKQIFAVSYPADLEISSRSVGTYKISNLYKLGTFDGSPVTFVRRKIQGFMRVPITGFLEEYHPAQITSAQTETMVSLKRNILSHDNISNLSRFDSLILYLRGRQYDWHVSGEDELIRANVIEKKNDNYVAHQERLKPYLGAKVFDWALGAHRATVAVVNESGEDGLGSEIAELLGNMGFDIVAVKGGQAGTEKTVVEYQSNNAQSKEILGVFRDLLGWDRVRQTATDEYRAQYVIRIGSDAVTLF
jgi:hypothetical protein